MFEEKRPTAVSVVGWVWIVLGGFMLLGGVLFSSTLPFISSAGAPWPLWYSVTVGALELLIGALGLTCGIGYLRLRAWARLGLEVACWALLATMALSLASMFALGGILSGALQLDAIFIASAIAFTVLYALPVVLMLRSLRSEKVRAAMGAPA